MPDIVKLFVENVNLNYIGIQEITKTLEERFLEVTEIKGERFMLNLIKNEWMKIFRRPGTYVMIGLLVLMVSVTGAFIKYQETRDFIPDNENWVQGLQMENEAKEKELEQMHDSVPDRRSIQQYERDKCSLNEYRIEHKFHQMENIRFGVL